jgi:hypothetical protein
VQRWLHLNIIFQFFWKCFNLKSGSFKKRKKMGRSLHFEVSDSSVTRKAPRFSFMTTRHWSLTFSQVDGNRLASRWIKPCVAMDLAVYPPWPTGGFLVVRDKLGNYLLDLTIVPLAVLAGDRYMAVPVVVVGWSLTARWHTTSVLICLAGQRYSGGRGDWVTSMPFHTCQGNL